MTDNTEQTLTLEHDWMERYGLPALRLLATLVVASDTDKNSICKNVAWYGDNPNVRFNLILETRYVPKEPTT
jgi:hypothetical protein